MPCIHGKWADEPACRPRKETSSHELRPLARGAGGEEVRPKLAVELLLLGAEDVDLALRTSNTAKSVPLRACRRLRSVRVW